MMKKWFIAVAVLTTLSGCGTDNASPVAKFQLSNGSVTDSGSAQLDASDSYDPDGEITSYEWDFGDGRSATGSQIEHIYQSSGEYTIVLTVTDDDGISSSTSLPVDVDIQNSHPHAIIRTDARQGIAPLSTQLSGGDSYDLDGDILRYRWQINGETVADSPTLNYVFNDPGIYSVRLTVTDNGGAEATAEESIRVVSDTDRFDVRGTLTPASYIDVDGDVNDPNADLFDNGGRSDDQVQFLDNPVLLHGYLTEFATLNANDTFGFKNDVADYYSVNLNAGDYVSLRIVDSDFADFDLYLIDEQTSDVLLVSDSYDEFESVQAQRDGKYLVLVRGVTGSSKYLLKIGRSSLSTLGQTQGFSADFAPDQLIIQTNDQQAQNSLSKAQLQVTKGEFKRGALTKINFLNPQTRSELRLQSMDSAAEQYLQRRNPKAVAKIRTLTALKRIKKRAGIQNVEPNYRVRSFVTPTDPAFPFQWSYRAVNLPQAWDFTTGSEDVVVAVIDTGIVADHPDLTNQLVPGYDFISEQDFSLDGDGIDPDPNDPGDSLIGDSSWHGTHVAGIVAAEMNNDVGGVGVAPGSKVMPLRAIGLGGGYTYDIFQAMRYAAQMDNDSGTIPERAATIINLSLGGGGYNSIGQELINEIRREGIFIVAAAGNENTNELIYPASYDGVISVAGTDFHGLRAPYSNYGEYVDIAAPGGDTEHDEDRDGYADGILSTVIQEDEDGRQPSYIHYQGTSMAAPHVSGIIALMKSVYPAMTPNELDSLIASGVMTQDRGFAGRDNLYGHGVIDAFLAVNAARGLAAGEETAALTTDSYSLVFDHTQSATTLEVKALGTADIALDGFEASETWLAIESLDTDGNGLGQYSVSVDREGLNDGIHSAHIRLFASTGQEITVEVFLQVGERREQGDAGYVYVFLVRADTMETEYALGVSAADGKYAFEFVGIPAGTYYLIAGSDIDNDGYICTLGEACGFYPTISKMGELHLYRDIADIDFNVGLSSEIVAPLSVITEQQSTEWPLMMSRW